MWWKFEKCLGTFTILLVKASSETELFRNFCDYVFGFRNFENGKSIGVTFWSKCLKFNLDFKHLAKKSEIVFCFWDNCIWIGIVKLSLLIREIFSNSINLTVINKYDKEEVMPIWTVLGHVYHVAFRWVLWNGTF